MRTKLPAKMVPKPPIWTLLKNFVGKDLIKITMPVVLNEPLTFLQRACEVIQYCNLIKSADLSEDPVKRLELVCAFIAAGISSNSVRLAKPFNPLLYETYENKFTLEDGSVVKVIAQQVSHHPPITAGHFEHDDFEIDFTVSPRIKFSLKSLEIFPEGTTCVHLKRHKERYVFKGITCTVHNFIIGKLWFEHVGPLDVICKDTDTEAHITFKAVGWFGNDLHRFEGNIFKARQKVRFIFGKWTDYVRSIDSDSAAAAASSSSSSSSLKSNSSENSVVIKKDGDKAINQCSNRRKYSFDWANSSLLWKKDEPCNEEYYNFTKFTMSLNELTPELEAVLPRTDSRLRPDVRRLEEGDIDAAASEKERLEDKQRDKRAKDKRFKDPSGDFLWFDLKDVPFMNEKYWIYNGGYWESSPDSGKFPDIF